MNKNENTEYYNLRLKQKTFSKYAVALKAVSYLDEGESMLIDAGSSLTPIAKIIRKIADLRAHDTHYTIMTHNNDAFNVLSDTPAKARFNVFQTGGRYDRDLNASFGHQAEAAYLRYHPKWVFIGQNGMEADLGLFCHGNTEELSLKKEIFAMPALGRIIIADFTKLGSPGGLLFGESSSLISNVEKCIIITDDVNDEKFNKNPELKERPNRRTRDRVDTQIRLLQETYEALVETVHFELFRLDLHFNDNGNEKEEMSYFDKTRYAERIETPSVELKEISENFENESYEKDEPVYRLHIVENDIKCLTYHLAEKRKKYDEKYDPNAPEGHNWPPKEEDIRKYFSLGFVDIAFKKGGKDNENLITEVKYVSNLDRFKVDEDKFLIKLV